MKVRVLGIGNVLMSDDGFGPFVVRTLDARVRVSAGVEFVDVGTPRARPDAVPARHRRGDLRRHGHLDAAAGRDSRLRREDILRHPPQARTGGHDPAMKEALLTWPRRRRTGHVTLVGVIPAMDGDRRLPSRLKSRRRWGAPSRPSSAALEGAGVRLSSRRKSRWCPMCGGRSRRGSACGHVGRRVASNFALQLTAQK
jgi:hypothetical protein